MTLMQYIALSSRRQRENKPEHERCKVTPTTAETMPLETDPFAKFAARPGA